MINELLLIGDVLTALTAVAVGAGYPPFLSGAFWGAVGLWGVVSIVFDDETPRGVPGMDVIQEHLQSRDRTRRGGV